MKVLLNIFFNNLDNGAERTPCNFANNTKQQEVSDTLEGNAAIWSHLDSLEKCANKDTMKFNQGKYKVLHQRKINSFINLYWSMNIWKPVLQKTPWGCW